MDILRRREAESSQCCHWRIASDIRLPALLVVLRHSVYSLSTKYRGPMSCRDCEYNSSLLVQGFAQRLQPFRFQ